MPASLIRYAMCCLVAVVACGGEPTEPSLAGSAELYWEATLNHQAITLALTAPYNTVRLHATPRNASGEALPGEPTVRYQVVGNDPSLDVTADGLVTALAAKAGIRIIADVTLNGVTRRDSVLVNINNVSTVPPLELDRIELKINGNETTIDCGMISSVFTLSPKPLAATTLASGNVTIRNTNVAFSSSNSRRVKVDRYTGGLTISCIEFGSVWLRATASVYGVATTDSLLFSVIPARASHMIIIPRFKTGETVPTLDFDPNVIEISAGATVAFFSRVYDTLSLTFDNPAVAQEAPITSVNGLPTAPNGSGNISGWIVENPTVACAGLTGSLRTVCVLNVITEGTRTRMFTTPGTYHLQSGANGIKGTIIVHPALTL